MIRIKDQLFLICFLVLIAVGSSKAQTNIYVSPSGNDENEGTIDSPLKTLSGAHQKVLKIKSGGLPAGGIIVNFREGRYPVTSIVEMGNASAGADGSPIVYTGYQNEKVIFDGTSFVNGGAFKPTTSTFADILHETGVGNVYWQRITDPQIIELLSDVRNAQMSMDDIMMTQARFPNIGFARIDNSSIGTTGNGVTTKQAKGTSAAPRGPEFTFEENFNTDKWRSEVKKGDFTYVDGYYTADWFKEGRSTRSWPNSIASVGSNGKIRLMNSIRYGFGPTPTPIHVKRMYVSNLLAELDEPGEWYYDQKAQNLFVWPLNGAISSSSKIGVWAGTELIRITDGGHIQIKNITIQGLGKQTEIDNNGNPRAEAAITVTGGENVLIAGVTFRYIASPLVAVNIISEAKNCKILSCDFYDNAAGGGRLGGGNFTPKGVVTPGNNVVENCHFTQVYSKSFSGGSFAMLGVGQTFRNNLVHNILSQGLTIGSDEGALNHLVEKNEFFNIGKEEGDGGAIYAGGDLISYGNVIRHNFLHHLMSVPELLGRAAIFSDDLDGGDSLIENVTYRAGWQSLKMNGGAGHTTEGNVVIGSFTGVFQDVPKSAAYSTALNFLDGNGTSRAKENYIGRMLQKVGKPGWDSRAKDNWYNEIEDKWKELYPKFDQAMKGYFDNGRMNAYATNVKDNLFNGTINKPGGVTENVRRVTREAGNPNVAIETGTTEVNLSIFENPDNLNFKFNSSKPAIARDIPFEEIGLYKDDYRCAVPNKDDYRRLVRQHFEGQVVHSFGERYNSETINDRVYFNSGELVMGLIPCNGAYAETNYKFDFGTSTSAIASGYERVINETYPGAYGWTSHDTTDLRTAIRNGNNALTNDLIFSSKPATFEIDLIEGLWEINVTFGDLTAAHDNMQVKSNGQVRESGVNTAAGEFVTKTFTDSIIDGKLKLEFSDAGGADKNWVVTGITATRKKSLILSVNNYVQRIEPLIYPNPVDEVLKIKLPKQGRLSNSVEILNNVGQIIMTKELRHNEVDLSTLPSGAYILRMYIDGNIVNKRFVKK